jgi:uncharacterized protein
METQAQRVGPVNLAERILFIDILRGMALFGILAANMRAFAAPLDAYGDIQWLFHGRADLLAQWFIDAFIQGKFITIFSFLFGMGFAIQLSRAEARGVRFLSFYPRRLLALALFGVIHGILIWAGDILLTYALSGAILLLFRNRQQKTLLWWAGGLFSLPIVVPSIFVVIYFLRHPAWMTPKPPNVQKFYDIINIYAHGTVRQMLAQNWVQWKRDLPTELFAIYAVALFLLGMWVWRSGIVQRLDEYKPILKKVCAWCLPIGLAMNLFTATTYPLVPRDHFSWLGFFTQMVYFPGTHILAAGYVSGLALIFLDEKNRRWLQPFAAVGRTALTNYLMESVICTLFFYHYTTGLYGRVGPALCLVPTVVLYSAQVVISNQWLKHYRFGPMEWLWRGLTYGKFPSMHKDDAAPVFAPAGVPAAMPLAAVAGDAIKSEEIA